MPFICITCGNPHTGYACIYCVKENSMKTKFVNPWILVIYAFALFVIVIAHFKIVFIHQLILMAIAYVLVMLAIKYSAKD